MADATAPGRVRKPIDSWAGEAIAAGTARDVELAVSESYSSLTVKIPIHIRRASEAGPVVFVTGALHGDEINGTGVIRQLIHDPTLKLLRGSLILVPVLNMLAFDRHSRYLPDRRDLNRFFPGSPKGSLASRLARIIFDEIVARSDYGIDLHTASVRRTNYPNVRADMGDPGAQRLAAAFGSEIIINSKGPQGSLRREATLAGCPTIVMEGGEVSKVEPGIVKSGTRGVKNVLRELQMLACAQESPPYQLVIERSKWLRAEHGGFMRFHARPGEVVAKGRLLATNTTLLGHPQTTICAPFDGVIMGMASLPAVNPGEPVFNLGKLPKGMQPDALRVLRREEDGHELRVSEQLASNVMVVTPAGRPRRD